MKKKVYLILVIAVLILVIAPPLAAPSIHNNHSGKSAIRNFLYKEGHPYQSFLAIITDRKIHDPAYGDMFDVLWKDWGAETGQTAQICYAKKLKINSYKVSCSTGP
ncbi:hypothetical protein [Bacillus sp. NEB1478]|uniref:hypothetical protein n=1 Tax=Bacillus sp. NEB1478 TaxID=3073816 RepID=UPI002872E2E3|nr:hypothetical protein [Bacillus sp. NEB1478]WNB91047.1 hypothetical protein RGB74_14180 [Bacillus sp. NEB1478]